MSPLGGLVGRVRICVRGLTPSGQVTSPLCGLGLVLGADEPSPGPSLRREGNFGGQE